MSTDQNSVSQTAIIVSFFIIYVVWGSTYLANAWAIQAVPPFLMAGSRFTIGGLLLGAYCVATGQAQVTKQQLKNSLIAGIFLFVIGNGLAVWALKFIDSGVAALLVSLQPLVVVMILWVMEGTPPVKSTWVGIALGIVGMCFLVGQPSMASKENWQYGIIAIFVALLAWGYISVWMKDADLPDSMYLKPALQMLFGGILLIVIGFLLGEEQAFSVDNITPRAIYSFIFLVLFGGIIAFTAFNFLIKNVSPAKVATSTYINPVVALFLGYFLNNEELTTNSIIAAVLLIGGVILINLAKNKKLKFRRKK